MHLLNKWGQISSNRKR